MNRNLLWRGLLILAIVVAAVAATFPLKEKINLGLDLQGGMHLVLQVHTEDALRAEADSDMGLLLQQAKEEDVTGLSGRRTSDTAFEITGLTPATRDTVSDLAGRFLGGWSSNFSDQRATFSMNADYANQIRQMAVTQAKQTISNRVDAFGVAEPVFQETSGHRILVQLPGVDDPERVRNLIKNTAFLEFRIVTAGPAASREELLASVGGQVPANLEILPGSVDNDATDPNQTPATVYYLAEKARTVTGRDLQTARPGLGDFQQPIVLFNFNPQGAEKFGALTGANIGKPLGIVLDGRVVSAPRINSQIRDSGQIEGGFTQEQAQDLSTVLRSGALPAGITTLEERTVGPSLGRDSIEKSLLAGLVGTALVVIFMLIIYNLSGLNAILAMVLNIVLLFGGLAAFDATLTLPGIAGILLTIGMAVDANVLIFERIREELRAGRTVRSAIDLGYEKALSSIIDGNVTTLIAALFLFQFGTGPIRGFAVTLTIGLLASMFTAVFVSRWMFDLVLSRFRIQKLSI
ncbi:MAG TPA: protein translocase subunit SecD [Thermoanaerobaculia bacterium]|nr:protein translocase subunit SecD [Thermoanaerobaculia bacterium]